MVTVGDGMDPRDDKTIKKARKIVDAARRGKEITVIINIYEYEYEKKRIINDL